MRTVAYVEIDVRVSTVYFMEKRLNIPEELMRVKLNLSCGNHLQL